MKSPFHLALHGADLDLACRFYGSVLGCLDGCATSASIDFYFFGHPPLLPLGEPL